MDPGGGRIEHRKSPAGLPRAGLAWAGLVLVASALVAQPALARGRPSSPMSCEQKCDAQRNRFAARCENPTCTKNADADHASCLKQCKEPRPIASSGHHAEHRLSVKHHAQSMPVWCWAASVAMVAEYLKKKPVRDCDVAERLDRDNGGPGVCCDHDGFLVDMRCLRGRKATDIMDVMQALGLHPVQLNRPLTWQELRDSIDNGFPVIVAMDEGGSHHAEVIVGYRAPDTVLIEDPWEVHQARPFEKSFNYLAGPQTAEDLWRSDHPWKLSWVFTAPSLSSTRSASIHPVLEMHLSPAGR
jgi:hypothetical protein